MWTKDSVRPASARHHSADARVRGTGRRARPLLVLLASLALSATLVAGFDAYGGKALPVGDGTATDANKAKTQSLIDQLKKPVDAAKPFGPDAGLGLTQAQAEARAKQIYDNVKKIIALAKLRSTEARAKFLDEQCKAGNVCISWGMTVLGTCDIDSKTDKVASEKIAIRAEGLVGGALPCHAPVIVESAETVVHENLHAGQSYAGEPPQNPTPDQVKAALGKKYACNEIDAHGGDATWESAMAMALCNPDNFDPAKPIPNGTDPAVAAVLKSLKTIADATARAAAAKALKDAMTALAASDTLATECYGVAKQAFMDFIAGTITKDQLKAKLNDNKWKHYTSWLNDPFFVTKQAPSTILQSAASGPGPDIHTGLAEINDFMFWPASPSGPVLLVIGEDSTGLGELQLYRDSNADQLFEEATKQVLFTGASQLHSNMALFRNPNTGVLHVYDAQTRLIHKLLDSNADGVPDQLGISINPPDPRLADYLAFEFVEGPGTPTLLAYQVVDSLEPSLPFDALTLRLRDLNADGFFETVDELPNDQLLAWDPTYDPATFQHLQSSLAPYGMPGAQLQVWLTNDSGNLLQLRGTGVGQGIGAPAPVLLSPPFQYGEQMVIVDVTHNRRSPNALLSPWEDLGYALAGTNGAPLLKGSGVLKAGSLITLDLSSAKPFAPSAIITGLSTLFFPLKGGTLVPSPDLIITGLPTDGTGHLPINAVWPSGIPQGIPFYFQFWIPDAGGPQGFAASNGLRGTSS